MEIRSGLKRLREKAERLHRRYEAMLVISNRLTTVDRQLLDREKQKLRLAKKSDLYQLIPQLEKAIADYRAEFGFKAPDSELVELLEKSEAATEGKLLRITKDWVEDLCTGYNKYAKSLFAKLPAHALIEIDPGQFRTKSGDISWYWLEARSSRTCVPCSIWPTNTLSNRMMQIPSINGTTKQDCHSIEVP